MTAEQAPEHGIAEQDIAGRPSEEPDFHALMDTALGSMGASGIITLDASDEKSFLEEQYRHIIIATVTNHSREPMQLYQWMPEAEYIPQKRKHPAVRVNVNGRALAGIPMVCYSPKGGATLMIRSETGSQPLLQFVRTLPEHPGHAVTFFKGELRQSDSVYSPTGPVRRDTSVAVQPGETRSQVVHDKTKRAPKAGNTKEGKQERELKIPWEIQLLFRLSPQDRENILSRMKVEERDTVETVFYEDDKGLHKRHASELKGNADTRQYRMSQALHFIAGWIRVGADGSVSRISSDTERYRLAMGAKAPQAGSEMSTLLAEIRGQHRNSKEEKRRRKGWHGKPTI